MQTTKCSRYQKRKTACTCGISSLLSVSAVLGYPDMHNLTQISRLREPRWSLPSPANLQHCMGGDWGGGVFESISTAMQSDKTDFTLNSTFSRPIRWGLFCSVTVYEHAVVQQGLPWLFCFAWLKTASLLWWISPEVFSSLSHNFPAPA